MFWSQLCLLSTTMMAIIMGAAYPQTTSSSPETPGTCNACCQGPVGPQGNPGIPGVGIPGSHGTHGVMGPKGEPGMSLKGDAGDRGSMGEPGDRGEKGDLGESGPRGLPGKMGPPGEQGLEGAVGQQGPGGVQGLPGEKGGRGLPGNDGQGAVTEMSAFTVGKNNQQYSSTGIPEVFTFSLVITNIGSDFSTSTSKFTCRVPGVYVFTFNVYGDDTSRNTIVKLVKNDVNKVGAIRNHPALTPSQDGSVSGSAVLELEIGDQVWLTINGEADVDEQTTNFSGYLLYQN